MSIIKITSKADVDKLLSCGLIKQDGLIVRMLYRKYLRGGMYTFYGHIHYSRRVLVSLAGCTIANYKTVDEFIEDIPSLGVLGGSNV